MKTIVFIITHPDDMELFAGQPVFYFLSLGYQIIEVLMTWGEYGTRWLGDDFKGKRIQKIRKKEKQLGLSLYGYFPNGEPRVKTIPMNFIDGYIPFNNNSIKKIQDEIISLKPDIVVGPDPIFSMDPHDDHILTGAMVFFALKKMESNIRPKKFFLYQTYKADFRIQPQSWKRWETQNLIYTTQINLLIIRIMRIFFQLFHIFCQNRPNMFLRTINIQKSEILCSQMGKLHSIWEKFWFYFFQFYRKNHSDYEPHPSKLGLSII